MAAPAYAYRSEKKLQVVIGASDGTIGEAIDMLIARLLQNTTPDLSDGYFNSTDLTATKISKIKALFKLDGFQLVASSENKIGFIGYCNIYGNNMQFHNNLRLSNLSPIKNPVSNQFRFFNDGGLNRRGECFIDAILNSGSDDKDDLVENYPPRLGDVKLYPYIYSPFYNPLTSFQVLMIREGSVDIWDAVFTSATGVNSNTEVVAPIENISGISLSGLHTFRLKVTNEEGVYITDDFVATIRMAVAVMKYDASSPSVAFENGVNRTVYRNTLEFLDYQNNPDPTRLYKNELTPPTEQDIGYFVLDGYWYSYLYNEELDHLAIIEKNPCSPGNYPYGDPGNITNEYGQVDCQGFDRDYLVDARQEVISLNFDYRTLYLVTTTDYEQNPVVSETRAYSDSTHTTPSGDGFYIVGYAEGGQGVITREIEVSSGVVISDTGNL